MRNAFTVDVEDWYQTNDFNLDPDCWSGLADRVAENTRVILDVLAEGDVRATFFILGCVARRHPDLVTAIARQGHEIASHGGWHRLATSMSPEAFRADVADAKNALEDIAGQKVTTFRAPSWSIGPDNLWALEILEEEGFLLDSSLQPFATPLSGMGAAPVFPFRPVLNGRVMKLLEFPPTVLKAAGLRIPFAGGFYLRACPWSFIHRALRRVNRDRPGLIYVHPWEIDPEQPRLPVSPLLKFVHYHNLKRTLPKIRALLSTFSFEPLGDVARDLTFPEIALHGRALEEKGAKP